MCAANNINPKAVKQTMLPKYVRMGIKGPSTPEQHVVIRRQRTTTDWDGTENGLSINFEYFTRRKRHSQLDNIPPFPNLGWGTPQQQPKAHAAR